MRSNSFRALVLSCPDCGIAVNDSENLCQNCGATRLQLPNGGLAFIEVDQNIVMDDVDKLKSLGKKFPKLYNILIDILSPVYPQPSFERRKFLKTMKSQGRSVVNLGSGSSSFGPDVVNFDIIPYHTVDVVCSIESIPLASDSVDAILNIAVLEHVPNPDAVIAEFFRVLKPGGEIYCFIPFIQGFHASPWDFQRFTKKGMEVRFKEFDIDWIHTVGPTSGMLWIFQEWIAILLSFGSKRVHTVIWVLAMLLTWPIKYLDVLLRMHPRAENISSGFTIKARKPTDLKTFE